jgi:elongation factor P
MYIDFLKAFSFNLLKIDNIFRESLLVLIFLLLFDQLILIKKTMARILVANELRPGHIVNHDGDVCEVKKYDFVTQGRGGSTVKLILQNIKTKSQKNLSINADIKFNTVDVEESDYEYMYNDGDSIFTVDGEEFPISKVAENIIELIEQAGKFRVIKLNDEIYKILLPKKAKVKIKTTEPTLKGQTAASSYKPAVLCNGWTIQVPVFFNEEDEIIIDATDLENPKYDSKPS